MGNKISRMRALFSLKKDVDGGVPAEQKPISTEPKPSAGAAEGGGSISNKVCFGAGCYWGTEKYFMKNFNNKEPYVGKIKFGYVGFMGDENALKNPSYKDVCTGKSGHVEVFYLEYDPSEETFEALVRFFFQFHDPTTLNKQGNDAGPQYASVIFCYDEIQMRIAQKVIQDLNGLISSKTVDCFTEKKVSTAIRKSTVFYKAEEYHQKYLENNPNGYCNHRIRFTWPMK